MTNDTRDDGWITLEQAGCGAAFAPPGGGLGRPGLWKQGTRDGSAVFDVPMSAILDRCDEEVDAGAARREVIEWARGTLEGGAPPAWEPPGAEALEGAVPPRLRTLDRGGRIARLEVTSVPGRFALVAPLARVDPGLTPRRRGWLGRLVDDARRLRLVRVGLHLAGGIELLDAEVDLTGVPPALAAGAAAVAAAMLHVAWRRLVRPAWIIADPTWKSAALDAAPGFPHPNLETRAW